jgi:oligoribonuclease
MQAIFLDIETTGLDPYRHRVVEIAFKILDPQTGEVRLTYQSIVKQPDGVWDSRDPSSVEINGFTREKMLLGQEEVVVKQEIVQIFTDLKIERGKAFYVCQNPSFDRGFFSQIVDVYTQENHHWPYHWLDFASMYWALQVQDYKNTQFPTEINLSKNSIAEQFELPTETLPHAALNGVNHLILCYEKVVGFKASHA